MWPKKKNKNKKADEGMPPPPPSSSPAGKVFKWCKVCGAYIIYRVADPNETPTQWLSRWNEHKATHAEGVEALSRHYMWKDIKRILKEDQA